MLANSAEYYYSQMIDTPAALGTGKYANIPPEYGSVTVSATVKEIFITLLQILNESESKTE